MTKTRTYTAEEMRVIHFLVDEKQRKKLGIERPRTSSGPRTRCAAMNEVGKGRCLNKARRGYVMCGIHKDQEPL